MDAGKLLFAALFFVIVLAGVVYGQPYLQWSRTYGGNENDEANSVQVLDDGGYIVAGYTESHGAGGSDVWLLRTDSTGDTLWTRVYGGSSDDQGISIQITPDGGFIIAGWTESFGSGGKDYYLIRTNAMGDILWTRTYGGSNDDVVTSVSLTADGGYILTGYTSGYTSNIIKTNAGGDSLWSYTFLSAIAYSAKQTIDGGYIIVGDYRVLYNFSKVYAVKLDSNGNMQWGQQYYCFDLYEQNCGSWNVGRDVLQTSDGGYLIAGYTVMADGTNPWYIYGHSHAYVIKTGQNGNRTDYWVSGDYYKTFCVQQTGNGRYIIGGTKYYDRYGDFDLYPDLTVLFKLNTALEVDWMSMYGGEEGKFVQIAPDRGYVLVGNHDYEHPDVYIVKTGPDEPIIRPEIELSTEELDFEEVAVGYQSELPLTIYNQGEPTLILRGINCGNTSFYTDYDPADSLIQFGDSLLISVTFQPEEVAVYNSILNIESNDEAVTVALIGEGVLCVNMSSSSFDFGVVHQGNPSVLPLILHNACDSVVVIRGISSSEISFSTTFDPADSVLCSDDSLFIDVIFTPHDSAVYSESLQLYNDFGIPDIQLSGIGIPSLSIPVPWVMFGNVPVGEGSEKPLTVYNISTSTVPINEIVITDPVYTTNFNPADSLVDPGDSLQITVTLIPEEENIWYRDTLTFTSRYEEISATLFGKGIPCVSVSEDDIDFGEVYVGYPSRLPVALYNLCDSVISVLDAYTTQECFTIYGIPEDSVILEMDTLNLEVQFVPLSNEPYQGTLHLEIVSGNPTVSLTGIGIPCIGLSAEHIDFGASYLGNVQRVPVVVFNICDTSVAIYGITTIHGGRFRTVYSDSLIATGDSMIFSVEFLPDESVEFSDSVIVDSDRGTLYLGLSGSGVSSFQVSPDSLWFGWVNIRRYMELPLTLYNISDTMLTLCDITLSDTFYMTDFNDADILIASGDSLLVTVTFYPPEADIWYYDTLTFVGQYEEVDVHLRGYCIGDKWSVDPVAFYLQPVFPNPFNTVASIRYDVPVMGDVEIVVYNVLGRKVGTLVSETKDVGYHQVVWDAGELPSGIYFVRMEAGEFRQTRKVVLLR